MMFKRCDCFLFWLAKGPHYSRDRFSLPDSTQLVTPCASFASYASLLRPLCFIHFDDIFVVFLHPWVLSYYSSLISVMLSNIVVQTKPFVSSAVSYTSLCWLELICICRLNGLLVTMFLFYAQVVLLRIYSLFGCTIIYHHVCSVVPSQSLVHQCSVFTRALTLDHLYSEEDYTFSFSKKEAPSYEFFWVHTVFWLLQTFHFRKRTTSLRLWRKTCL